MKFRMEFEIPDAGDEVPATSAHLFVDDMLAQVSYKVWTKKMKEGTVKDYNGNRIGEFKLEEG